MSESGLNQLQVARIPRISLKLRAGSENYETVPDLTFMEPLLILQQELSVLRLDARRLLAMRVRSQGMEPLLFEDDWVVIDIGDTVRRNREVFALNWNGEVCVQQLVERGGQWYLNNVNPDFHPINVRSGHLSIIGRVVYQPGRTITGRL
ncbi:MULTISPECIES: S24 family peptidase [unclassified Massilia]|uniref:S24 family peptidase n=1 Tax=unclassified Massilia TaxID=2609279 RepID=UPI0017845E33|nr:MULTISPECIES: S24 family peptidase [unclassified Massilia]MBD8531472.1 S24 family peptidase [Massilia sp. CFBP 13647]MBD8673732.1 S24 family peptidase [Massilia sp. CFBP 13721]